VPASNTAVAQRGTVKPLLSHGGTGSRMAIAKAMPNAIATSSAAPQA
jgi:hypothetical protein